MRETLPLPVGCAAAHAPPAGGVIPFATVPIHFATVPVLHSPIRHCTSLCLAQFATVRVGVARFATVLFHFATVHAAEWLGSPLYAVKTPVRHCISSPSSTSPLYL